MGNINLKQLCPQGCPPSLGDNGAAHFSDYTALNPYENESTSRLLMTSGEVKAER